MGREGVAAPLEILREVVPPPEAPAHAELHEEAEAERVERVAGRAEHDADAREHALAQV